MAIETKSAEADQPSTPIHTARHRLQTMRFSKANRVKKANQVANSSQATAGSAGVLGRDAAVREQHPQQQIPISFHFEPLNQASASERLDTQPQVQNDNEALKDKLAGVESHNNILRNKLSDTEGKLSAAMAQLALRDSSYKAEMSELKVQNRALNEKMTEVENTLQQLIQEMRLTRQAATSGHAISSSGLNGAATTQAVSSHQAAEAGKLSESTAAPTEAQALAEQATVSASSQDAVALQMRSSSHAEAISTGGDLIQAVEAGNNSESAVAPSVAQPLTEQAAVDGSNENVAAIYMRRSSNAEATTSSSAQNEAAEHDKLLECTAAPAMAQPLAEQAAVSGSHQDIVALHMRHSSHTDATTTSGSAMHQCQNGTQIAEDGQQSQSTAASSVVQRLAEQAATVGSNGDVAANYMRRSSNAEATTSGSTLNQEMEAHGKVGTHFPQDVLLGNRDSKGRLVTSSSEVGTPTIKAGPWADLHSSSDEDDAAYQHAMDQEKDGCMADAAEVDPSKEWNEEACLTSHAQASTSMHALETAADSCVGKEDSMRNPLPGYAANEDVQEESKWDTDAFVGASSLPETAEVGPSREWEEEEARLSMRLASHAQASTSTHALEFAADRASVGMHPSSSGYAHHGDMQGVAENESGANRRLSSPVATAEPAMSAAGLYPEAHLETFATSNATVSDVLRPPGVSESGPLARQPLPASALQLSSLSYLNDIKLPAYITDGGHLGSFRPSTIEDLMGCVPARLDEEEVDGFTHFTQTAKAATQTNFKPSSKFGLKSKRLKSEFEDGQARHRYSKLTQQAMVGTWKWVRAPFSPAVRMLARREVGIIGKGAGGDVHYGEMLMANDEVEACALKRLPYDTVEQQQCACSELEALRMTVGVDHVVQGLAAFEHFCPVDQRRYVWIATRYEEGMGLGEAVKALTENLAKTGTSKKQTAKALLAAGKLVVTCVLKVLQATHSQERGICDIKEDNMRVRLAPDGLSFAACTMLDMGGSAELYTGVYFRRPVEMAFTPAYAAPEVMTGFCPGEGRMHLSNIDIAAHDIWGAGCLLLYTLTGKSWFSPQPDQTINQLHAEWKANFGHPRGICGSSHPVMCSLRNISRRVQCPELLNFVSLLLHPSYKQRANVNNALSAAELL